MPTHKQQRPTAQIIRVDEMFREIKEISRSVNSVIDLAMHKSQILDAYMSRVELLERKVKDMIIISNEIVARVTKLSEGTYEHPMFNHVRDRFVNEMIERMRTVGPDEVTAAAELHPTPKAQKKRKSTRTAA